MRTRSRTLRVKTFKRDNFTCKKCKFEDQTMGKLEAHHIIPLYSGGKNDVDNMITLCFDCHHFTPDKKEEFERYMEEEMEGTLTNLMKSFKKVREEHQELFDEIDNKLNKEKNKNDKNVDGCSKKVVQKPSFRRT